VKPMAILPTSGGFFELFSDLCWSQPPCAVSLPLIAPLAQLDRASVYGTEGYWFEPSGV
jgi:hypothetical protein